ncbi:trypsin-like serine peptidase [Granulosicoccus antarcticus]|uniref:Peptidase S1 domain-containing protein n=1 Tax=Granulosicoccus antarcticus IMCC3135 TaxID=1192854 RepID=A0A2Z2NKP1_9GAMM|nr:hypothetical protein [Granulosicoccus antarcticus]ASJ71972.1 hypothetical protein IMCC3135_09375 [Granulosicoccus antarcticus IMCC3135]
MAGTTLLSAAVVAFSGGVQAQSEIPKGLESLSIIKYARSANNPSGGYGDIREIDREKREPVDTANLDMSLPKSQREKPEEYKGEKIPDINDLNGKSQFEFFDIESGRSFQFSIERSTLAKLSRQVADTANEHNGDRKPATKDEIRAESRFDKSWSWANDSRSRRGIQDGYSDTNTIYQNLANYGGCSATVLSANSEQMVALTAAHCIYRPGNQYSYSNIEPRKNGVASPTWGTWSPVAFGFYPSFIDNDCEDNWNGSVCIKYDIALVIARPDAGATPPRGMGWGYRNKTSIDTFSKYRRGYPGCGAGHSPMPCSGDYLYGDGQLNLGNYANTDSDNWYRRVKFSSDLNPGDSGSGLYYYRDGNPYVFAVTSAEDTCYTACWYSRPNHARRITPEWYDFINSVVF